MTLFFEFDSLFYMKGKEYILKPYCGRMGAHVAPFFARQKGVVNARYMDKSLFCCCARRFGAFVDFLIFVRER
ncbi:hypothetical protein KLNKPBOH_03327 [Aeromonas veronii]